MSLSPVVVPKSLPWRCAYLLTLPRLRNHKHVIQGGTLFYRYAPQPMFAVGGITYSAAQEAVLIGHEDWVHTVAWQPTPLPMLLGSMMSGHVHNENDIGEPRPAVSEHTARRPSPLCLLSASMDRTMCLWRPDAATGVAFSGCMHGPVHL